MELDAEHYRSLLAGCTDNEKVEYYSGVIEGLESKANDVPKPTTPKRSKYISNFLDFIKRSNEEYVGSCERLDQYAKQTQDLLHELELSAQNDEDMLDVARRLREVRRERRIDKDCMEETVKVVDIMNLPEMQKFVNQVKKLLGDVRKVESYHENRVYRKKAEA